MKYKVKEATLSNLENELNYITRLSDFTDPVISVTCNSLDKYIIVYKE